MKRCRFLTWMSLVLALAALFLGVEQGWAQTGPNPAVDYTKPNWASSSILRKFVDKLPGLGPTGINNLGQYIPVAVADKAAFAGSDYYEIAVVDYRERMHSDLPATGTLLRGYVQIETPANAGVSRHIALKYPNGNPILDVNNNPVFGVDNPHYLGPLILATQGIPTRIKFYNYISTGGAGNLFIPVDVTVMGAGMGPDGMNNYSQNRATIHLHGGNTPWISDGTPHQWITPYGELTPYPTGASLQNVPDMPVPSGGAMTFYYPNQQSGRLMFYHDHAYGLTRLNVYAGEAAGYLLVDPAGTGEWTLPTSAFDQIPLVIQDKTFVNDATVTPPPGITANPARYTTATDPLWTWGAGGNLWFPHVYIPNQDPNAEDGANPFGRWDYGPWFWPIFPVSYPLPTTSIVPEAFMDTPIVNGTAYPYIDVQPKAYRFRILNACNDRFLNLQLYRTSSIISGITVTAGGSGYTSPPAVTITGGGGTGATATATVAGGVVTAVTLNTVGSGYLSAPIVMFTGGGGTGAAATTTVYTGLTEVGMVPYFPPQSNWPPGYGTADAREGGVPDPLLRGPAMIQIGSEGGLLQAPTVINNIPINYDYDRRSVTVLNVLEHALFLGPAERADVIIDFSKFAGKTLILYNDSPAPVPAGDTRVDYYTGNPDQTGGGGAPSTLPGYGPNTRTIMQIRVAAGANPSAPPDDYNPALLSSLQTALPTAFAATQPAPIVTPGVYARIQDTSLNITGTPTSIGSVMVVAGGTGYTSAPTVSFLGGGGTGATATATLGIVSGVNVNNAGTGYTSAPTVSFVGGGGTGATATATVTGGVVSAITVTNGGSGYTTPPTVTITGGGGTGAAATATVNPNTVAVITVTNGGTGYTFAPTVSILGGGGTGAVAFASLTGATPMKPKAIQELFDPYGRMNAVLGVELPFTTALIQTTIPLAYIDPPTETFTDGETQLWKITHNGVDTHAIHFHLVNAQLVNRVGWDGVIKPPDPNELGWKDTIRMNPLEDIIVAVQAKSQTLPFAVPVSFRPLDVTQPLGSTTGFTGVDPNTGNPIAVTNVMTNFGWEYVWHCHILGHEENDMMRSMVMTVAEPKIVPQTIPNAASNLAAAQVLCLGVNLTWTDNSNNETGFEIQRATDAGFTLGLTTFTAAGANATSFIDTTAQSGIPYYYRVRAYNSAGYSTYSNTATITIPSGPLLPPSGLSGASLPCQQVVNLTWTDNSNNESGFQIERATDAAFTIGLTTFTTGANVTTYSDTTVQLNTTYYYRVRASNATCNFSSYSNTATVATSPTFTITATANANGIITPSGAVAVCQGNNQTFTMTPNAGYIPNVTVDGTSAGVLTTYTFTNVIANHTIAVNFALPTSPPPAATLISPSGVIATNSPTYTWNAVLGSTWYNLYVNDPSGNRIAQWYTGAQAGCASGTGTCSVTPATVLGGGACRWWVQTYNSYGGGPWSAPMNFTTPVPPAPPPAPTLVSPTGTIATTSPTYVWNALPTATDYFLWVNDSSGNRIQQWYTAAAAGCGGGTGNCSVTPATVLNAGAGQWWVQAKNGGGTGPWSAPMSFTVSGGGGGGGGGISGPPGAATLISPSGAAGTNTPTYTWNAVNGSTWYYLWVNDSTGNKITQWYTAAEVGCPSGTGTCSVNSTTPHSYSGTGYVSLASGAGKWWIQTNNSYGNGPWSAPMNFTVP